MNIGPEPMAPSASACLARKWLRACLVVLGALLASAERPAVASCLPRAFFAPEGTTLGPSPTLYLFSPIKSGVLRLDARTADGKVVAAIATEVSDYSAYRVFRIAVASAADFAISASVEVSQAETEAFVGTLSSARSDPPKATFPLKMNLATARFRIGPLAERRPVSSVGIAGMDAEESKWTCSFQQTRNLLLTVDAPAFRLEWAKTAEDYHQRRREALVLPAFRQGGKTLVKLGHLDCVGWTFPWTGGDVFVGVAALHADGSETPAASEPFRLARPADSPSTAP
ncbi:MAG: hypothetical protein HY901_06525 [Deltaproteobacteria bacterium]|nr:hypothetical protein [Deltaproteobacteria bacterium]